MSKYNFAKNMPDFFYMIMLMSKQDYVVFILQRIHKNSCSNSFLNEFPIIFENLASVKVKI